MNYDGDLYQSVRSAAQVRGAELGVEQWNAKEIGKAALLAFLDNVWHDISEEADLSKPVLLYDVDGDYMSPPSKFLLKDMPGFVSAMNRKYGANYTKWMYMEDIIPRKEK